MVTTTGRRVTAITSRNGYERAGEFINGVPPIEHVLEPVKTGKVVEHDVNLLSPFGALDKSRQEGYELAASMLGGSHAVHHPVFTSSAAYSESVP
jgi:hypothetical protein